MQKFSMLFEATTKLPTNSALTKIVLSFFPGSEVNKDPTIGNKPLSPKDWSAFVKVGTLETPPKNCKVIDKKITPRSTYVSRNIKYLVETDDLFMIVLKVQHNHDNSVTAGVYAVAPKDDDKKVSKIIKSLND